MVTLRNSGKESSSFPSTDHVGHMLHDVFLSFRGEDTRYGFISHLHKALEGTNFAIFLDDKVIKTGEVLSPELTKAIKASRASIIVLSKDYASSSWCLNELVLILEQRRSSKQIVIPIFYHVDPSDVRNLRGTFKDAMDKRRHAMKVETDAKKRSDQAERINKWINALAEVADLKGNHVKDNFRLESEFIDEVVKDIRHRLHIPLRTTLPKLIGRDDSIEYLTSWLKDNSSQTGDILTIWGMGGIGKTSLAQYVYMSHFSKFDTSSFIQDIGRSCAKESNGLSNLLKKLCDDITKTRIEELPFNSMYTSQIENATKDKKVFLVLDDVVSKEQLDALLGRKGFHRGSKIIVITREKQLTKGCALLEIEPKPKHVEHQLQGLYEDQSRQLLCVHAFKSKDPKAGYEETLEKMVKYCEGHPLALTVLGESLHNEDVSYWEDRIKQLENEIDSKINNVLKTSFDSLTSNNDKDLFKHIACFFVGMDRDFTETILKACKIQTTSGIKNLTNRCLLSIGWNGTLVMHQLIQDMGRHEVRKESPELGKRSRLWYHEDAFQVLKHKKGTDRIWGLTLDMKMFEDEKLSETFKLEIDAVSKMDSLMLLQLNFVKMIDGSYVTWPEELRCLCIHGFSLKSIPSDLPMENLVALDMSYSNIESFGVCYSNPQQHLDKQKHLACSKDNRLLGSLKILILSFCGKLRNLGCFDGLPALERLTVTNCSGLLEVCESIQQCSELVHINLSYCKNVVKLPRTIRMLKKVETLLLEGCNLGGAPIETMDMNSWEQSIDINTRTSSSAVVKAIPSHLKFITRSLPESLVTLWLANNKLSTESFPIDFSCLSKLKDLCLNDNPISVTPNCLRSLPGLEVLHMAGCSKLTTVHHLPPSLRFLNLLSNCGRLHRVVFDPEMSRLRLGMDSLQIAYPCDIEGILKIQSMTDVEERVLDSLGWTNPDFPYDKCMETFFACNKPGKSNMQIMFYEFGIFTTHYTGKEMPNWITYRSKRPSISFIIPSSPNNIRGLNVCSVQMFKPSLPYVDLNTVPSIKITNITKNLTWIYESYDSEFRVDGGCLILLSHWMFGMNEMEAGDQVTIIGTTGVGLTKECGVSFVYDDGKKADEEEDALGYYKSWNHIIGGDLKGFQLTTGEYILRFDGYARDDIAFTGYLPEFVEEGAIYKEKQMWFKALSQKKSGIADHTHEEREDDNGGAIGMEENSHGCKANLPNTFQLSLRQYRQLAYKGPTFDWGNEEEEEDDEEDDDEEDDEEEDEEDDDEEDDEEEDDEEDEVLADVPSFLMNFGASTQHINKVSGPSTKSYIQGSSSGPSIQSSALAGFSIPKSNRKTWLRKTADDMIRELDEQLPEEDDGNLRCRSRPRRRLMDAEQILDFPVSVEKEVRVDKGKAIAAIEGTLVVNVDKGKAIDATEGTSDLNDSGSVAADDILTKQKKLVEQAQNKMKAMEAENSELVNRVWQAEIAWATADSQLERSEALSAEKLEVLESEKKQLVEKVAMLEAVDAKRMGQLEVVREDLNTCHADLEWVLQEGLRRCFDKILKSEAFLRASTRLHKACTNYGIERGCQLMRDRFQLQVADAELPNYKPDRVGEVKEAYSSFNDTNFVATAGLGELSVDALRAFCLSSDDESN